jgi:hypothetical protein
MISVSDQAKEVLWSSLQQSGISAGQGLRLQTGPNGFILELDKPTEEDRVIRHQETPVLIIDGGLDEEVEDLLIDVTESPQGPQLTIRPFPASPDRG